MRACSSPSSGRPAKLYRRARSEVNVSLPRRRYDLASQVLADAVERALAGTPMHAALVEAADEGARVVTESWPHKHGNGQERIDARFARLGKEPPTSPPAPTALSRYPDI